MTWTKMLLSVGASLLAFCALVTSITLFLIKVLGTPSLTHPEFCRLLVDHIDFSDCRRMAKTEALEVAFPVEQTELSTVNEAIGEFKTYFGTTSYGFRETYKFDDSITGSYVGVNQWGFKYNQNEVLIGITIYE